MPSAVNPSNPTKSLGGTPGYAAPNAVINPNTGLPMPSIGPVSPGYTPMYTPDFSDINALKATLHETPPIGAPGTPANPFGGGELGTEAIIPFDPNVSTVTNTYGGPSPGQLQAQLAAQIASLQGAGKKAQANVGNLYKQLAGQLGQYIPQEDAAYNATIRQNSDLFRNLDRSIDSTYAGQGGWLANEMARLGQGNRAGGELGQLAGDENFLRGLAGIIGSGNISSLQFLKQGAHNYNQDVTGMARTEGTNRQADIAQAILAEIAAAQSKNAAAVAKAQSDRAKGQKITNPSTPSELLAALAGKGGGDKEWATKALQALTSYIGSPQAQSGGRVLYHNEPQYSKDASGNVDYSKVTGQKPTPEKVPENASSMYRYLIGQLQGGLYNPKNQATAQQLANLLSEMYFKKNF